MRFFESSPATKSNQMSDLLRDLQIVVDGRALAGPMDGIGRWTAEMIPRLSDRLQGTLHLASSRPISLPDDLRTRKVRPLVPKIPIPGTIWVQTELPRQLDRLGADLLVAPLNVIPIWGPTPSVVVIHDLTSIRTPERHTWRVRWSINPFLGSTLRRSSAIVTPSRSTADELLAIDPGIRPKLFVVPNGVDRRFSARSLRDEGDSKGEARERFASGNHYVLFVGTLEPRKDVGSLVEALEKIWVKRGDTPDLVLGGRIGWKCEELLRKIESSPHRNRIHRLGHLPDDQLVLLYRGADLFVYPSLDEGFGLPPIEAMASGVPVVVRDLPVLREVCGDAAWFAAAEGSEPLILAIETLLTDSTKRAEQIERGKARAGSFDWNRSADSLAEICRRVIDDSHPAPRRS